MERSPKPKYNIDPASVDWKRFLGNAPDQPCQKVHGTDSSG